MEAPLLPDFRSEQIFSGFDNSYRLNLHASLFELVWFGQGRWDWHTLYNMPIFLRNFWMNKISEIVEQQQTELKRIQSKKTNTFPTKR